jgi:hypothetical protein
LCVGCCSSSMGGVAEIEEEHKRVNDKGIEFYNYIYI